MHMSAYPYHLSDARNIVRSLCTANFLRYRNSTLVDVSLPQSLLADVDDRWVAHDVNKDLVLGIASTKLTEISARGNHRQSSSRPDAR